MEIFQHYRPALFWKGMQTVYYRLAYSVYFFLLYYVLDAKTFGLIGTCFSMVYLFISWCDFGLTQSLTPYFLSYSQSKNQCKLFFKYQFSLHALVSIFVFLAILSYKKALIPFLTIIPSNLFSILFFIFVLESTKNILKKNLDQALYYRTTSSIEMMGISIFFMLIIVGYITQQLSAIVVFNAILVNSLFCVSALIFYTVRWYASLDSLPQKSFTNFALWPLIKIRFFSQLNKLSSSIFSSNLLIPLIASHQGLEAVGTYKLIGTIAHTLVLFLEHTFGATGEHMSANSKQVHEHLKIFTTSTIHLFHVFLASSIFFLINYKKLLAFSTHTISDPISYGAYFLLLILPSLFFTYKSLFLVQQRFDFYLTIKLLAASGSYALLYQAKLFPISAILFFLLIIKIIALTIVALAAQYLWNASFPLNIKPLYLCGFALVSWFFFLIL